MQVSNELTKILEDFLYTAESVADVLKANPGRRGLVENQAAYLRGAIHEVQNALINAGVPIYTEPDGTDLARFCGDKE